MLQGPLWSCPQCLVYFPTIVLALSFTMESMRPIWSMVASKVLNVRLSKQLNQYPL